SRWNGVALRAAVHEAGLARFRPILLTSLTTAASVTPLILEKSVQAKFLIPMAVGLAGGVLFSTVITLVLVPCGYLILEDIKRAFRWLVRNSEEAVATEAVRAPRTERLVPDLAKQE
ncbi:MAG: efflux RND transporter permease subunit, partial [bacterium]|nr:efflux RND transporter permease subunit [bacterium]